MARIVIALFCGCLATIVAFVLPGYWTRFAIAASILALFLVFGVLAGLLAPSGTWRLGVLVASPFALLVLTSLVLAANTVAFVLHDLVLLASSLIGAGFGTALGSQLRERLRAA